MSGREHDAARPTPWRQVWTSDIAAYGPWKHIVGVNAFGALVLGVLTSPKFPKVYY